MFLYAETNLIPLSFQATQSLHLDNNPMFTSLPNSQPRKVVRVKLQLCYIEREQRGEMASPPSVHIVDTYNSYFKQFGIISFGYALHRSHQEHPSINFAFVLHIRH